MTSVVTRLPRLGRALALLMVAGCVSPAIDADVRRVRALTRLDDVSRVTDGEVLSASSAEAERLLAAPLRVESAVRVALLNNRQLRASLREMGITRGRLIQAGLLPNPRAEVELLPERNSQIELRLEYDVTNALLAPLRARAAESEHEAARTRAAGFVLELGYRVREAFYRVQASEQRLRIAEQMLDVSAASRDAARAIEGAGNWSELELATEEAAHEQVRIRVAELELEAATEREALQRWLGAYGTQTAWRVDGFLPAAPEEVELGSGREARALVASLELLETRHRLEALARQAGFSQSSGLVPDVSVDVHALHGNPAPEGDGGEESDWRFGAGLSLTIPVFDRGQGTTVALEAEFDALLERYQGMAVDIRSSTREAQSRLLSSHARARRYKDVILPAQRRVTEQTLLQYNAMQLGIFQLLDARRAELDAELAYVETLRQYWSAAAELAALLAGRRVLAPAELGATGTGN